MRIARGGIIIVWATILGLAGLPDPAGAMGPMPVSFRSQQGPYGILQKAEQGKYVPLLDPAFSTPERSGSLDDDRVIAGIFDGKPVCFPLRLMTYHHVAVLRREDLSSHWIITYCALADSAVTFQRVGSDGRPYRGAVGTPYGSYGGTLVVALGYETSPGWVFPYDVFAQLRPFDAMPPADFNRQEHRTSEPLVNTTFGAWVAAHPDTSVLRPDPKFGDRYREYDESPRGYQPSAAREKGLKQFDTRMPPGTHVFGVAAPGAQAWCWTFDHLRSAGESSAEINGVTVRVRWDEKLNAPMLVSSANPPNLVATQCYWYAWGNFYPHTILQGQPSSTPDGPPGWSSVVDWSTH